MSDGELRGARAPNPLSARTVEEFGARLRQLKVWAADPSFAELQRRTGIPSSTLADALSPRRTRLPRLDVVRLLVRACGGGAEDVASWEFGWRRLQERQEAAEAPEPPRAARPHQLPRGLSHLVGRDRIMERLHELQRLQGMPGGRPALALLVGAAGAGKTALALHWGHLVAGDYPDGQLHLDLRGTAPGAAMDLAEALASLLQALGVPPGELPLGLDAQAGLFRSITYSRRLLVVLDNARDAEHVRPLLPSGHGCFTLVTSRNRLSGLIADGDALRLSVGPLPPCEAELLIELMLGDGRTAREPAATRELARLCGYLPAALRIAAANLADRPGWPVSAYLARLVMDGPLDQLTVAGDDSCAVRSLFEASYSALDSATRRLFRLLPAMSIPIFDADEVAPLDGAPVADTARRLETLAAVHLLERAGPDRYTVHELVRIYAQSVATGDALSLATWVPVPAQALAAPSRSSSGLA
jgi:hypothetical protein